ncbi:hypothetical protein KSP40_PGU003991 [Platanthera guangdongensis]|uniref:Uncharacterized protein n=1 Tax=Platanthera guangdongensis TaxID=2320717 RepID=A0ABR2MWI0_9ASPA
MSNDWSHAETMQATHPVYFAQKISEAVSHANLDWMDQPSASIIIQGLLKPAFVEEHKLSKKLPLTDNAGSSKGQHPGKHIKDNVEGEIDNDQSLHSSTTELNFVGLAVKVQKRKRPKTRRRRRNKTRRTSLRRRKKIILTSKLFIIEFLSCIGFSKSKVLC